MNYVPFNPFSYLANLFAVTFPSGLMLRHQWNSSPLFRGHFSPVPRVRPAPRARNENRPSQATLRRIYGVPNEDFYSGIVQHDNATRHANALQNNTDGASYLKSLLRDYLQSLPEKDRTEFKNKIKEGDPEIFIEVPRLAVKKAISSTVALTKNNTPFFMHKHLDQLEQLRKTQAQLSSQEVWKQSCDIATALARETDCIASMQKAFESL